MAAGAQPCPCQAAAAAAPSPWPLQRPVAAVPAAAGVAAPLLLQVKPAAVAVWVAAAVAWVPAHRPPGPSSAPALSNTKQGASDRQGNSNWCLSVLLYGVPQPNVALCQP